MSSTPAAAEPADENTAARVEPTAGVATAESKETAPVVPNNAVVTEEALTEESKETAPAVTAETALSNTTSCACNKSRCLKLYCDCLSNGKRCGDKCQCKDCRNTGQYEGEAFEAMRAALDRNPDAFNDAIKQQLGWVPEVKTPPKGKKRGRPKGSLNKVKPIIIAGPAVKRPRGRPRKDDTDNTPTKSLNPPPEPIAFTTEEYPQLAMDSNENYSHLATSFTRPLFPPADATTSKPLQIAYSHHAVARHARKLAQVKKNELFDEYKKIREKYLEKKLELSLANDEVEKCDKEAGAWTKKVFDLELEEPCDWNEKLSKLKKYVEEKHKLPPKNISRCENEDEKELSKWLENIRGNKVRSFCLDASCRLQSNVYAQTSLNFHFQSQGSTRIRT